MPAITAFPMWLSPGDTRDCAQMYNVGTSRSVKSLKVGVSRRPGSNNDAERVRSGHVARGELRIVGRHGPGADDDRVAQRAHAVQVHDVVAARDGLRVAGGRPR